MDWLDKLQDYQHSWHELHLSSFADSLEFVDSFAEGLLAAEFVGSMVELPLMVILPVGEKQLPAIVKSFLVDAAAAVIVAATAVEIATAVGVAAVVVVVDVAAAAADSYKDSSLPSALVGP